MLMCDLHPASLQSLCLNFVPAVVCLVMLTWRAILVASQKAHCCSFECVVQVTQQHGKEFNATSRGAMPYADATIKEALRFIAIVTAVSRKAIKTFEVVGYTIPKASLGLQQVALCNILDIRIELQVVLFKHAHTNMLTSGQ